MLELLSRRWWLIVLRGVVAVVFGLLAVAWPEITVLALALLWGIYVLADGVSAAMIGFAGTGQDRTLHLGIGALGVLTGVLALVWPGITALVLLVVIAVWAIIAGVMQIVAAVRLRKVIRREWFLAVSGAVSLVLGLLLIVQPTEGAIGLVIAIATFVIAWGVVLIVLGFRLRALGARTTV